MAVPFRRISKSARRKRRTHFKLTAPHLVKCSMCGEARLSHRICPSCGSYKGQVVMEVKKARA